MKKLLFSITLSLISVLSYGCHLVTITETSAVYNGDGTFTYTFDVCLGQEDSYGFYIDFGGSPTIISATTNITSSSTGNTVSASFPPISGSGDLEYGDWDDNTDPLVSDITNDCFSITVTVDSEITDATVGGTQIDYFGGPCSSTTTDVTSCFADLADYQVDINVPNCNNKTYGLDIDDNVIASGVPTNGGTATYYYCGGCGTTFTAISGSGCNLGNWSVTLLADGSTSASGSGDVVDQLLSPCTLPIELINFELEETDSGIEINWTTATETDNDFFTIERSTDGKLWKTIMRVDGSGTTYGKTNYTMTDRNPDAGHNYYRLKQTDFDGSSEYTGSSEIDYHIIDYFSLQPNPATKEFDVVFDAKVKGEVNIELYDLSGRKWKSQTVDNTAGINRQKLNIDEIPKGVYLVKVLTNDQTYTGKLVKR